MKFPTLGIKGNLKNVSGGPPLDDWVPIDYIMEWFRARVNKTGVENRVLVLKSETGSGKSTLFPPVLYRNFVKNGTRSIICTQPRVMTAIENVNDMVRNNPDSLRLGENIGWSTKSNKLVPKKTGILSATIGTLAQQLRTMEDQDVMKKYGYILIDEVHERDLQTDITIQMLKNFIYRNKNNQNCPFVVLMSATFDENAFLKYFGVPIITNFIWCSGEKVDITEIWEWDGIHSVTNYTKSAVKVVEKILAENPDDDPARADILIFMPGKKEFKETASGLYALNKQLAQQHKPVFSLLQIDSVAVQTRNQDYQWTLYIPVSEHEIYIDEKKYTPRRRVIISTNVAETGLTLNNLKYVIDSGYNREIEYNPIYGVSGLITKPAPKSRVTQRRGRVGRKFPGIFYPLYPKSTYNLLQNIQLPQILKDDISIVALDIINEQLRAKTLSGDPRPIFKIEDIDMLNAPTPDAMMENIELLYSIGFISTNAPKWDPTLEQTLQNPPSNDLGITKLGSIARTFQQLPPRIIRMILAAFNWDCSILDMIGIAAYLLIERSSFTEHKGSINWISVYKMGLPSFIGVGNVLYKMRLLLGDEFIDGVILYNAIRNVIASADKSKIVMILQRWCSENNLSYRTILDFIRVRDDIIEQMISTGLNVFSQEEFSIRSSREDSFIDIITRIKYCIYEGFRTNVIVRAADYRTLMGLPVRKPRLFNEDEETMAKRDEYGFVLAAEPTTLVYNSLSLKYNTKGGIYEVVADRVSVLDGFVSIDLDFMN